MAYRRILVGTDGSDTARRAEAAARRLATAFGAELVVAHAMESPPKGPVPSVERAAEQARAEGLQVVTAVPKGKPADALVELADRRGVDLVVLGDVGMTGARRFLGSVPNTVSHRAPCDILIVRTGDPGEHGAYRRAVVATDGSPTADRAVRKGVEFTRGVGAETILVYVGHPVTGRNVLGDTIRQLDGEGDLRPLVMPGDPVAGIVKAAQQEEADLVVVGSRGMTGSLLESIGAVPNKVSHRSPTDVYIAKTYLLGYDDVKPGEAAIVSAGGKKLAVYKSEDGAEYVLSAKCKHMGCTVGWNSGEKTWDCPCHGSRYRFDGTVIQGPAQRDLDPADRP
jgi:nucleotide-binding universal stress UspA family protein/nitrite reductase/ring-hydroxylating ferredoxin subunit